MHINKSCLSSPLCFLLKKTTASREYHNLSCAVTATENTTYVCTDHRPYQEIPQKNGNCQDIFQKRNSSSGCILPFSFLLLPKLLSMASPSHLPTQPFGLDQQALSSR